MEIGVSTGLSLPQAEPPTRCLGIDPAPQVSRKLSAPTRIFSETSGDFFAKHDLLAEPGGNRVRLAFIDGLHHFDAVLRDCMNIERHSSRDTVVLLHDCLPVNSVTAMRERKTKFWSGDTWKIVSILKRFRPDLSVCTIPAPPTGLTVVTGLDACSSVLQDNYETIVDEYLPLDYGYLLPNKAEKPNVVYEDWPRLQERITSSTDKAATL